MARRLELLLTNLITPPVYMILLPFSETALLTLNDASTDAAVMNKVSSAKILPGHTLESASVSNNATFLEQAPSSVAKGKFTRIRVEGLISLVQVAFRIHLVRLRVQLWIVQHGPMGLDLSLAIDATSVQVLVSYQLFPNTMEPAGMR